MVVLVIITLLDNENLDWDKLQIPRSGPPKYYFCRIVKNLRKYEPIYNVISNFLCIARMPVPRERIYSRYKKANNFYRCPKPYTKLFRRYSPSWTWYVVDSGNNLE